MFRSFFCLFANESARSLNFIEHAMERLPLTDHGFQAQSNAVYGIVAQMEGQTERVTHELQEKLSNSPSLHLVCKLSILWALTYLHYLSGDADGAARYISRLREDSELHDANNHLAWSYYFDGLLHLQRGEWSSAIQLLEKASVHRYAHHTKAAADNLAALTLAYHISTANNQPGIRLLSAGPSFWRMERASWTDVPRSTTLPPALRRLWQSRKWVRGLYTPVVRKTAKVIGLMAARTTN